MEREKKKINRKLPFNQEAEQSLLGAIMIDSFVANEVVPILTSNCFYIEAHKIIFAAIKSLMSQNLPIDIVSVNDCLEKRDDLSRVGGIAYLSDLTILTPSGNNYKHYLDIVKRDAKLRELIVAANTILDDCSVEQDLQTAINKAEKAVFDVTYSVEQKDLVPITDGLMASMGNIEAILTNQKAIYGLETGFSNLDRMIRGYQPGQMIVLAARPGCGKTSFAMNIVANIALKHPEKVVAVFNLEMSVEELTKRLLLSVAEVPSEYLYTKRPSEVLSMLWKANEQLGKAQLYIDDTTGTTPEQIMSKCRRLKQRTKRLDFVVIDYLQLLRPATPKSNMQAEVAEVSRSIKIMAKELKVPLLILSQTSRDLEKRDDKAPKLSDLRDSGAIEQDADQVYFLTKEASQPNDEFEVVDLNILKHRSGSTGKINLKWQGNIVKFTPLESAEYFKIKNDAAKEKEAKDKEAKNGSANQPAIDSNNVQQSTTTADTANRADTIANSGATVAASEPTDIQGVNNVVVGESAIANYADDYIPPYDTQEGSVFVDNSRDEPPLPDGLQAMPLSELMNTSNKVFKEMPSEDEE